MNWNMTIKDWFQSYTLPTGGPESDPWLPTLEMPENARRETQAHVPPGRQAGMQHRGIG